MFKPSHRGSGVSHIFGCTSHCCWMTQQVRFSTCIKNSTCTSVCLLTSLTTFFGLGSASGSSYNIICFQTVSALFLLHRSLMPYYQRRIRLYIHLLRIAVYPPCITNCLRLSAPIFNTLQSIYSALHARWIHCNLSAMIYTHLQ